MERVHTGMYYELTDEDRQVITEDFNDGNLKELMGFCESMSDIRFCLDECTPYFDEWEPHDEYKPIF